MLLLKQGLVTLMLLSVNPAYSMVEIVGSEILKKGSGNEILFRFKRETQSDKVVRTWSYPDGQIAVQEEVVVVNGSLKSLKLQQMQVKEQGELTVDGDKLNFKYTKNGETKTSDEKLNGDLVSSEQIYPHVVKNWSKIKAGETLEIRYPVLDRRETIGFKLFKDREITTDGTKRLLVKMKPSSFVIAALVSPLVFEFDQVDSDPRLITLDGRTIPKIKEGEKWKDLDAFTKFVHKL